MAGSSSWLAGVPARRPPVTVARPRRTLTDFPHHRLNAADSTPRVTALQSGRVARCRAVSERYPQRAWALPDDASEVLLVLHGASQVAVPVEPFEMLEGH